MRKPASEVPYLSPCLRGSGTQSFNQSMASQLADAFHSWARLNDYETVRCECFNQQRSMLHMALDHEYDIVGLRYDADHGDNLILLQKTLSP